MVMARRYRGQCMVPSWCSNPSKGVDGVTQQLVGRVDVDVVEGEGELSHSLAASHSLESVDVVRARGRWVLAAA